MRRLPILSSDEVITASKKAGFDYAPKRGKGAMSLYTGGMNPATSD